MMDEGLESQLSGRPARELVPTDPQLSGRWHCHDAPGPYNRWNYHPEYEVHLITGGTGQFVVGEAIGPFGPGHLALIGSGVPHHFIADPPGEVIPGRDMVFQFHPRWIEDGTALLPELASLRPLLQKSNRGIEFRGRTAEIATRELRAIGMTEGMERLSSIVTMLATMASAPAGDYRLLAKSWLPSIDDEDTADIIDRVFDYIVANLENEVTLGEAAQLVGMSTSALSRYFKRAAGQTFSDAVRKLRLTHACRWLCDTSLPVSSIYLRVGYSNLSNFNRQFRATYGMTPTEYRQERSRGKKVSASAV